VLSGGDNQAVAVVKSGGGIDVTCGGGAAAEGRNVGDRVQLVTAVWRDWRSVSRNNKHKRARTILSPLISRASRAPRNIITPTRR